jgi:hypothetical protein
LLRRLAGEYARADLEAQAFAEMWRTTLRKLAPSWLYYKIGGEW